MKSGSFGLKMSLVVNGDSAVLPIEKVFVAMLAGDGGDPGDIGEQFTPVADNTSYDSLVVVTAVLGRITN